MERGCVAASVFAFFAACLAENSAKYPTENTRLQTVLMCQAGRWQSCTTSQQQQLQKLQVILPQPMALHSTFGCSGLRGAGCQESLQAYWSTAGALSFSCMQPRPCVCVCVCVREIAVAQPEVIPATGLVLMRRRLEPIALRPCCSVLYVFQVVRSSGPDTIPTMTELLFWISSDSATSNPAYSHSGRGPVASRPGRFHIVRSATHRTRVLGLLTIPVLGRPCCT